MYIVVNGINAPAPTVYEASLNPQQKSAERNGNGRLVRETLPDKWTIQCEWSFASPEECYAWFNTLRGLTQMNFTISFPAPTGATESATFYISPISAKMFNFSRGVTGWWRYLKCSFVEV